MDALEKVMRDNEKHVRIECGSRWLVATGKDEWTVYERLPYAKKTTVCYEGMYFNSAVYELTKK